MRLDVYLTKYHDIQSRNKASELIKDKRIKIDGKIITKSSFKVEEEMNIEILEDMIFVSRSAKKLKYFLDEIELDLQNKIALDIGSSTGGFTQVLLEYGIKEVSCVDVGSNQLHESIRDDKRIEIFENTDIREFNSNKAFDIITCDVSFISILNIIEDIDRLATKNIIILFKPQYEVGNDVKRNRAGVVQDQKAIDIARNNFISKSVQLSWNLITQAESKVAGKEGNIEELFYFKKVQS
jgi:23S rRNA (cytidine1920-2'-O)/16S rRNA (cytidine1409-2'-O)-methyltransferase